MKIELSVCILLCLVSFPQYYIYEIHLCCIIAFFLNAINLFCWWIFRLLPCLSYYEKKGYAYSCTCLLMSISTNYFEGGLCPKEVGLLYNQVYVCLDLVATAKCFPKWFYNLHFHQHCERFAVVFIILAYTWYFQSMFCNLWW